MNLLYSALAAVAFVLASPYWLLQMLRRGKYRAGLAERFGRVPPNLWKSGPRLVWVHAVSVGEVLAIAGVVRELRTHYGENAIAVSTTTTTGKKLARERFGEQNVFYFPLDFAFAIRPYLRALRPQLVVIAETELWPNFLRLSHEARARIAVVNARVSDRSFPRYRAFRWFLAGLLRRADLFLAQGAEDARRLIEIGAPAERVRVSGNLKFDVGPAAGSEGLKRLRDIIGTPVLVCGSTVEDEEEILLKVFRAVLARFPSATMVLAPRHPERFAAVAEMVRSSGLPFWRRTEWRSGAVSGGVFLLDSIGELAALYEIADVAFVGGSLAPHGGHNILEPARFGVATVVGPYTDNFRDIIDVFARHQAVRITTAAHLEATFLEMLADDELRRSLGERARQTLIANAGATSRTLQAIDELLTAAAGEPQPAQSPTSRRVES